MGKMLDMGIHGMDDVDIWSRMREASASSLSPVRNYADLVCGGTLTLRRPVT